MQFTFDLLSSIKIPKKIGQFWLVKMNAVFR